MAAALPFAMAGASVLSGVMQGAGSIAAGNAQAASAAENARIMSENAGRLKDAADSLRVQGVTAAARARRQGLAYRGATLSAYAGAGVDISQGSPLDVLVEQAGETEFQALNEKFKFDQAAWEKDVQAYDMTNRALMVLRGGQQAQMAGVSAAVGAEIGGVARAGSFLLTSIPGGGGMEVPAGGSPAAIAMPAGARPLQPGET